MIARLNTLLDRPLSWIGAIPGPGRPEVKLSALGAIALAGLTGYELGPVTLSNVAAPRDLEFRPVQWQAYNPKAELDALNARPLWGRRVEPARPNAAASGGPGANAAAPPAVLTIKGYRVSGVIQRGTDRYVMIKADGGDKIDLFGTNTALPDGALVREVRASEVVLERDGQLETRRLFDATKK